MRFHLLDRQQAITNAAQTNDNPVMVHSLCMTWYFGMLLDEISDYYIQFSFLLKKNESNSTSVFWA